VDRVKGISTDWDDDEREALEAIADDLAALRERHRRDPPLDLLHAARADLLPEALEEKTAAHLDSSAWSRTLVDGAEASIDALDAASADRLLTRIQQESARAVVHDRPRTRWLSGFAFAAVSLVVIAGAVVWRQSSSTLTAPTRQPPADVARQPSKPASAFALQLTKPDVKLTPGALLLRGNGSGRLVDDIAPGLNAYRAGEYDKAARELEGIRSGYPTAVEILFYLGISRLFLDDPTSAARALESALALNDDSFNDDAKWYLALANERAGDRANARNLVEQLCRGTSAYASRACATASALQ